MAPLIQMVMNRKSSGRKRLPVLYTKRIHKLRPWGNFGRRGIKRLVG